MGSGRWDQGGEFLEKGEGIEPHGRGAVGKGFSQAVEDGAVRASGETFGGDGGAGHVTAKPLQSLTIKAARG